MLKADGCLPLPWLRAVFGVIRRLACSLGNEEPASFRGAKGDYCDGA